MWSPIENPMLLMVGAVVALIASAIVTRLRVSGGEGPSPLGSMSEQWLAEHRASHSL